jgi:endonuclease-3
MAESSAARAARAGALLQRLEAFYPDVRIELNFRTPIELLVSVILSAQCTDRRVNAITPALFARFPAAEDYARLQPRALYPRIRSCGLYRNKARAIVGTAREIVLRHGGVVPARRAELRALPGVGAKSAGVITLHLEGGEAAFPVDTHVGRLARRMGFSKARTPEKVERDLQKLFPPAQWGMGHQLLVRHGRRTCHARKPACASCVVSELCPKIGVDLRTAKGPVRPRGARRRGSFQGGALPPFRP